MASIAGGQEGNMPPEIVSSAQRARLDSTDGKGSLILRIKRKRGTDPISALRIENLLSRGIDPDQVEEHARRLQDGISTSPEDRVGDFSSPKRRLTEQGIFRLADTVSASTFADEASTRKLEQRINELKKAKPALTVKSSATEEAIPEKNEPTSIPKITKGSASASEDALRFTIVKPIASKVKQGSLKGKDSSSSLRSRAMQAKYNRSTGKGSISSLRKSSDASIAARKSTSSSRIRFIDAIMERSKSKGKTKGERNTPLSKVKKAETKANSSDAEMEMLDKRFADLLGSYLKDNDLEPPKDLYDSSVVTDSVAQEGDSSEEDSEEDYVYDIYFREKETMWGFGPAGASDAGLRPAEVAGREELGSTFNVAAERQYKTEPMATLVGFSDENDLISEMENASILMGQEMAGDSEDEFDEGEDEDSNDEGFYRNDYPEDEGLEEDEMNQAGWGWSGPRRRKQKHSSADEEDDEDESSDSGSDLHH